MMNFIFHTPSGKDEDVFEEQNCVMNHRKIFSKFGKKAFIITGRFSAEKNGSLGDVKSALNEQGISWVHFNEIEENPSVETVVKAAEIGKREKVDFVIGIGGGSPLDAAKAIALLIANPTEGADYLYTPEKKDEPLNIVAIPTTCGTGSEVTGVSVLTRKELGTKKSIAHKIFPEVALIDPKYLRSASLTLICNTAMDAFGHMAESALSKTRCSECLDAVEKGLKLFSEVKNYLVKAASSDEVMSDFTWDVYEKLILASMYGGIAIAYAGTTIPHGLSYQVTIRHNVPHGKAIGYFQYGFLKEAPKKERDRLLSFAGFSDIEELKKYFEVTCGKEKVPAEILLSAVDEVAANEPKMHASVFSVDREMLLRIVSYVSDKEIVND